MDRKNIFIKNNNLSDNLSEDLSDELNNLMGITKKKIINNIPDVIENIIKIDDIYNSINNVLQKNKNNIIKGEIISFKISDTNAWIAIKSENYQISGIFWKITQNSKFKDYQKLVSGDQVTFEGSFGIMKKNLSIYFNIKSMSKIGLGEYLNLHHQNRLKIHEIGMNLNKKKIVNFPFNIGIITALDGAAIQDILQTFKIDKFIGKIIIKNTIVQGKQCPLSIINAIDYFENNYFIDLLLITRGGGSFEDLVGFSDWNVLERINSCKFITISAVGHQIDNQLSDEVADYNFATPSIAAKYIVETQANWINNLNKYKTLFLNYKLEYKKAIDSFNLVSKNYDKIIYNFEINEYKNNIKNYSNIIKNTLNKYKKAKELFFNYLTNLKPTIIKNKEVTTIDDFIDPNTKKELNPKKIEIYFADGKIKLYYKIIEYESYK